MLGNLFTTDKSTDLHSSLLSLTMGDQRALYIGDEYSPLSVWKFFTHYVRRYPQDLRAHVQRILIATQKPNTPRLPGSLQDLFLTLEHAGDFLKENMLSISQDYLDDEERHYFSQWLEKGFEAGQNHHQWRLGSVLCKGYPYPTRKLVIQEKTTQTNEYGSVLEEVHACLEYGQVDIARNLLEAECLTVYHSPEIEAELLNIYQYTRDKERLQNMIQRRQQSGKEVSEQWIITLQEAEKWQ